MALINNVALAVIMAEIENQRNINNNEMKMAEEK